MGYLCKGPSIPDPRRCVVAMQDLPLPLWGGSAPPNLPGLGLYPSIPEPRRRVVVVRVPQTLTVF